MSGVCAATQGSCVPLLPSVNSPALPPGATTAANMSSKRAKAKTTKKRPQRATSNVFAMFDQSQIQEFKEAFNMIDQNRDGFIDKEDLHDMLASMGEETLPYPSPNPPVPFPSRLLGQLLVGHRNSEGSWSACSEPTVGVALGHNPPALGQFGSAKAGETSSGALIGLESLLVEVPKGLLFLQLHSLVRTGPCVCWGWSSSAQGAAGGWSGASPKCHQDKAFSLLIACVTGQTCPMPACMAGSVWLGGSQPSTHRLLHKEWSRMQPPAVHGVPYGRWLQAVDG